MWPVSLECKSLLLDLISFNPAKRPSPLNVIRRDWLIETERILTEYDDDEQNVKIIFEKLNNILEMKPLELALRRKLAKTAQIINKS